MTALSIVGGILLFLAFLLACPVTLQAGFQEEFSASVRYLFFRYTIAPRPAKEEKQPQKEEKAPEKSKIKLLLEQKGLSGFLDILRKASQIASGTAKRLFSHLTVNPFLLEITVAGNDAAQTALSYGHVCGAVGTAAGLFLGNVKCKKYRIVVKPDFKEKKSSVNFRMKAHIRLLFLLAAALYALFHLIKVIRVLKNVQKI